MPDDTATLPAAVASRAEALARLRERFAASTDGVLETIAAEQGLTLREVAACLPASTGTAVPGTHFLEAMADIAEWGDVTFLLHTADLILECAGPVPRGSVGHGYFNLHGHGPIGGHIRFANCAEIRFLSRGFMGKESHAVLFFNGAGGCMFKVFVGREPGGALKAAQVARFQALRDRLAGAAPREAAGA